MSDEGSPSPGLLAQIVRGKQARLFELLELVSSEAFESLYRAQRIDIIYTSNALEGNLLSADETRTVIEDDIAVGGKSMEHHLQALDHAHALDTFEEIGMKDNQGPKFRPISLLDLDLANHLLHRRTRWLEETYIRRTDNLRSDQIDKPPQRLMDFSKWLKTQPDTPDAAIAAHNRLIGIEAFAAGNALTARLILNFILMRGGYPPIAIQPEDAAAYSEAIRDDKSSSVIDVIILRRLSQTLDLYIETAEQTLTCKQMNLEP